MIASDKENYKRLEIQLAKYNSVLIGCGMGKSKETMEIVEFILECHNKYENKFNLIIDADAINNLAELIKRSKVNLNNIILTPHLGELANLAQFNASKITLNERSEIAELIIEKITNYNITNANNIVIAKGPYTVIKDTSEIEYISPFATSLLSTAGSGDVLAGLIASLSAQGLNMINSSILGVYLHGLSALLKKKEYGNVGLLASDIADNIPFAIKKIREIV
jgi:NAD(P)H-hydrate epimerase